LLRAKLARWYHLKTLYLRSALYLSLRTFLHGIIAAISGTFFSMVLAAIAQILIVRSLNVILYGEYATITAILSLVSIALGLGLDTWVLHYISRYPDGSGAAVRDVLVLKSIGATVLLVVVMVIWSARISNASVFMVGVFGVIFESFTTTGYSVLRAVKRNGAVALFQITSAAVQLVVLWFGNTQSILNVFFIFGIHTFTSFFTFVTLFWYIRKLFRIKFERNIQIVHVIRESWLMVSSDTLALIYGQIVVVILSASFGYEEVGIFRSALNIIVYSFIVPSLIFAVGLPVLSRITCKEDFRRFAIFLLIFAVSYGLCFILLSMMFGSTFIDIIYGSFHAMVLHLIHSMSIVVLLKSINMISAAILIVTNRIKYRVAVQFVVVVFSVLAGTALIPTYGVDAAIFLTIAIECILLFGYGFFALKSLLDV